MEEKTHETIPKDPVPEAVQAVQPEGPVRKKRRKWPVVLLIVIIVLGAGGYFVYQNLPSTQAENHLKKAESLYSSGDLDSAVTELFEAKRLMPENAQDYDNIIAGYYNTELEALIAEKKYEDAVKLVEKEKEILPDRKDQFNAAAASYYTLWAEDVFKSEDTDSMSEMIKLIDSLPDDIRSDALSDVRARLFSAVNIHNLNTSFESFREKISALIKNGEWDKIYSDIRSDLFTAYGSHRDVITTVAANSSYLPLLSEADADGNRLGLYNVDGMYYLYFGQYEQEKRSGNGIWITVVNKLTDDSYRNYRCESEWANDTPNGNFTEYDTIKTETAETARNRITSGTTDLGLYSGKISYKYDNTAEMFGTFSNGHPTVIMNQDPNGEHAFVIAISDDQRYWVTNHEGANGIHGILGFR